MKSKSLKPAKSASGSRVIDPSRRRFLAGSGVIGAGLVIGLTLPRTGRQALAQSGPFAPNAFVRIAPDNTVTVVCKHVEFGQGPYTGLATILAEELDADWSQIRVVSAPSNPKLYNNLHWGPAQGTGGSTAVANSYMQMREAGAMARQLLVQAAVRRWGVPAGEIRVIKGVVSHGSGKRATFGALANAAGALKPGGKPRLKDPSQFTLIGTSVPRVDSKAKSDGTALFTMDVTLPGMLTAVLARPPRFGGKVASVDAGTAKKVEGVVDVVTTPQGVAVLAKNFWAAKKGRDALVVTWDESAAEKRGSEELFRSYRTLAKKPGAKVTSRGDAAKHLGAASASGEKILEAEYLFPYLAHAPMEPMDAVLQVKGGRSTLWAGSQAQTVDHFALARTLGLPPDKISIDTLFAGGSFGRRATTGGDEAVEVASIVKAAGTDAPVKLIWTREDDIAGGRYRPLYVHRLRGAVDARGRITAWEQRIVGQSILKGSPFEKMLVKNGIDGTSVEGARGLPYAIPNFQLELHTTDVGVPVLWWRSVGHTHTAYSTETFFDRLVRAAGQDPVETRLALLKDHPRHAAVLKLAAEKARWGRKPADGRALGVAVHESFNSFVAQVAEISLLPNGLPKVHKVWCAVDCGVAVNPNIIEMQMQSGIGYGLGHALFAEVTLDKGVPQQDNFHNYRSLRIEEMPEVEVHIVKSAKPPTGVGEPGLPPIAPAVANAYLSLTGKTVDRLPFVRALNV